MYKNILIMIRKLQKLQIDLAKTSKNKNQNQTET